MRHRIRPTTRAPIRLGRVCCPLGGAIDAAGPSGTFAREPLHVALLAVADRDPLFASMESAIKWSLTHLWPHLVEHYRHRVIVHHSKQLGARTGPRGRKNREWP